MRLNIPTYTQLLELFKNILRSKLGVYLPFHEHDLSTALAEAIVLEDLEQHINIGKILQMLTLYSTTGEFLDLYGSSLGLARQQATSAIIKGKFHTTTPPGSPIFIPSGITVYVPATTTEGSKKFTTLESTFINIGDSLSAEIEAEAELTGSLYNGISGNLTLQGAIPTVDYFQVTVVSTGGLELETDSTYRQELKDYIQEQGKSTETAIENYSKRYIYGNTKLTSAKLFFRSTEPLGLRNVLICNDGMGMQGTEDATYAVATPYSYTALGGELYISLPYYPIVSSLPIIIDNNAVVLTQNIDYYVDYGRGKIEFMTPLVVTHIIRVWYTFYGDIIYQLQKELNTNYIAAGSSILVRPPESTWNTTVNITAVLTVKDETLLAATITQIKSAITEYIRTLAIGDKLSYNNLIEIMLNPINVIDVNISAPTTDVYPANNLGVIVLGTLAIG